jgi:hypothetical protein
MDMLTLQLINPKAYKLLEDMEKLNLIRIIKAPAKISSLRGQIKTPMDNDEIDKQIEAIRKEWQRDFN